jgi:hypothetical protein
LSFAHVGGVPVEETLGTLAPVAVALAAALRAMVYRARAPVRGRRERK